MKVNVYVMTYNRSALLKETMGSILKQNYQDFDLIVLDNCSSDDTELTVRSFQDKRIHYIRHEKNIGGCGNTNYAMDHCDADYFVMFHDDDLMYPDFLEKELEAMEENPEIAAVGGNAEQFGAVSNPSVIDIKDGKLYLQGNEYITRYLRTGETLVFPSVMYRNSFIQEHGIRSKTEPGPCGDIIILADIEKNGGILCQLSDVIMKYRMHENQDSSRNFLTMHIRLFDYLRTHPDYKEIYLREKAGYMSKYDQFCRLLFSRWIRGLLTDDEARQTYQDLRRAFSTEKESFWGRSFSICVKHPQSRKYITMLRNNRK